MPQPDRTWDSSASYRYGYNGMETDPEVKGERGSHYTTYFRQYDSRVGRWWSNDPVVHSGESPYAAFHNNPALLSDPFGNDPPDDSPNDPPVYGPPDPLWLPNPDDYERSTVSNGMLTVPSVTPCAREKSTGHAAFVPATPPDVTDSSDSHRIPE